MRRSSRQTLQWGGDFLSHDDSNSVVVALHQQEGSCSWGQGGVSTTGRETGRESEAQSSKCGLPLSIVTSPPQLDTVVMFKKRPSPPLTSPSAVKSSMAQKKKRPAPLLLTDALTESGPSPPSTLIMGPTLSTVDLNELALEDIIYEGYSVYGIQSSKGRRRYMEDTCCAYDNLDGDGSEAYFGVFDGHGGRKAADFAAKHLYEFMASDKWFGTNVAEAVGAAFLKADKQFVELAEQQQLRDGTTAVSADSVRHFCDHHITGRWQHMSGEVTFGWPMLEILVLS